MFLSLFFSSEPETMLPISKRSQKIVMIHYSSHQLHRLDLCKMSLFETLLKKQSELVTTLNGWYRMQPSIKKSPNEQLYDGKIQVPFSGVLVWEGGGHRVVGKW